ncbi:hypothetical protein [Agromyces humi]|uniref:hypothetical protein n=1 Tax=Agromyces humi TaxID=1766800 RepID=UPI00135BD149|nr:hypothetical protein [Agromyces humi]
MNGHAQAALENAEGAEQARKDFAAGVTVNPFTNAGGWRRLAWQRQTELLTCRRDHDRAKCCWEHQVHLRPWNRSFLGITSCPVCNDEANAARRELASTSEEARRI